jgi:hypothetical protein
MRLFQFLSACQHSPTLRSIRGYPRNCCSWQHAQTLVPQWSGCHRSPKVWLFLGHGIIDVSWPGPSALFRRFNHFHATQKMSLTSSHPATFPILDQRFYFCNFSLATILSTTVVTAWQEQSLSFTTKRIFTTTPESYFYNYAHFTSINRYWILLLRSHVPPTC